MRPGYAEGAFFMRGFGRPGFAEDVFCFCGSATQRDKGVDGVTPYARAEHVARLRRSRFYVSRFPALTGWANVWRAYGAWEWARRDAGIALQPFEA